MNTQQTLINTLNTSAMVLGSYVGDLTDEELMNRPGEGCNHIAWQLGHLINSECGLMEMISPGSAIELPEGFAEKHSNDQQGNDSRADFCSQAEYLALTEKVHAASIAMFEKLTDDDFAKPAPEHFRQMFPTMGHVCVLLATHPMMHAGQVVPVRRKTGKPVVI